MLLDLHQPLDDALIDGVLDMELLFERQAESALGVELTQEEAELEQLRAWEMEREEHTRRQTPAAAAAVA